MRKRNPHIARALFWDALILLALSVYELCVRLDSSWGWAKGYFLSHLEARTPLSIIVKHIPYHNLGVWMYMRMLKLLPLVVLLLLCLTHVLLRPAHKRPENQPGSPSERHRRSERHRAA